MTATPQEIAREIVERFHRGTTFVNEYSEDDLDVLKNHIAQAIEAERVSDTSPKPVDESTKGHHAESLITKSDQNVISPGSIDADGTVTPEKYPSFFEEAAKVMSPESQARANEIGKTITDFLKNRSKVIESFVQAFVAVKISPEDNESAVRALIDSFVLQVRKSEDGLTETYSMVPYLR